MGIWFWMISLNGVLFKPFSKELDSLIENMYKIINKPFFRPDKNIKGVQQFDGKKNRQNLNIIFGNIKVLM